MRQPRIYGSLQIFLHCLGGLGGLVGNGDGKAHIVGCPELLAPGHESLSGCPVLSLIHICNEAGVYYIAGKALGRGKSLDRMLNLAAAFAASKEGSQVALLNGDAPREALELQPRLLEKTLCKELLAEGQISPALVVHTGPGLLGIAVLRGGLDG